jgi:hypothetical protein
MQAAASSREGHDDEASTRVVVGAPLAVGLCDRGPAASRATHPSDHRTDRLHNRVNASLVWGCWNGSSRRSCEPFETRPEEGGQPHSRDTLAALLWGERSDERARDGLRYALLACGRPFTA